MGYLSLLQRQKVLNKTNGMCAHCGKKLELRTFTVDHYIPKSKGGKWTANNLIPLCKKCNITKGDDIVEPRIAYPYINMLYENQLEELFYKYCDKEELVESS